MSCCGSPAPWLFSSFTLAVLASKSTHLYAHFETVPLGAFLLYLPTFYILDILAILALRLLLQTSRGGLYYIPVVIGGFISYVPPQISPPSVEQPDLLTPLQASSPSAVLLPS